MISIRNLTMRFGGFTAIDDLSAELNAPICGLIGPNGAGKTTLINVLSGFIAPRQGTILAGGEPLLGLSAVARVRWGLRRSFQTEQVVEDLTVRDNILAVLDQIPAAGRSTAQEIAEALDYTGLARAAHRPGRALNLFERRMVELAKSLVGRPRLLLLDEPGAGLDEQEAHRLRQAILGIPAFRQAQVLLIDHDVSLITDTCEETLVLDFGRRLALGPTRTVLASPEVRRAYLGA